MTLAPQDLKTRKMLAMAYTVIGKIDEAAQIYRDWLVDSPEDPIARHLHAACTGEGVPERADDAYIRETFNSFAETFDTKLERLDYRAPGIISHALREALARLGARSDAKLRCLDAGCGTGLCGPLIAPCVHQLIGVDLLEHAGARPKARSLS
jgi:predicted TPR repeat methyltransferase